MYVLQYIGHFHARIFQLVLGPFSPQEHAVGENGSMKHAAEALCIPHLVRSQFSAAKG